MNATTTCGYCGRELPPHAPEGLCPDCLLGLGQEELGLLPGAESSETHPRVEDRHEPERARGTAASAPTAVCGRPFGNYELLEIAGQGGMGVVYKARQFNLNRIVAVKLLPLGEFSGQEAVQRLRVEATAAASLHHPNIVAIHEFGEQDGQHFISMDYVEGRTLADVARDQPLPPQAAAGYLKTIAEAVHHAHERGILHRDLKPSNILLDVADRPRITDFGLAKRFGISLQNGLQSSDLTITGQVLGSPSFVAPEQLSGSPALGPAADVYSLGAVLYYLLTRQPPFQADTIAALFKQVSETDPAPPRLLNPRVPPELETICLKCLEKERSRRYLTAESLAQDLGRFLEGRPIQARPVGALERAAKWCRRHPALAGMTGALVIVFLLGLAGVMWQWQRATRMARAELQQRQRAQAGEYAADMHLAQLALNDNNRALALTLLEKYRPAPPSRSALESSGGDSRARAVEVPIDPRGWEWRYLWQLCQGDESFTLHRYPRSINAVAVSRNFNLLALTTADEMAIWDLTTRRPLSKSGAGTAALAFSPTEDVLAVGGWNEGGQPVVDICDVSGGNATKRRTFSVGNHWLSFSPDGKFLAVFDSRGKLTITEQASGRTVTQCPLLPLRGGTGLVVFSPDGSRVAIGEEYGRLRLLHLQSGTNLFLRTETGTVISAVAFSPDSGMLAAGFGYGEGTIRLWNTRSGEPCARLTNHTDDVTALLFTRDSQELVSASLDGTIRVWSLAEQKELRHLQSSREGVRSLALLADGKTMISGGAEGSICFWDATRSRPAARAQVEVSVGWEAMGALEAADFAPETLHPSAARRFGVAFTPDSRNFITMRPDGALTVWETRSFRQLGTLPLGSNHWAVALSSDGHWLATGDASGKITVWDWTTRLAAANFAVRFEWFGLLRFSPSSRYLMAVIPSNNRVFTIKIWRTGTWEEMPLTSAEFEGLLSVDLSPDDSLLAAGYGNGAVKLFHWPSCTPKITCGQAQSAIWSVCFSPQGGRVGAASSDGTARVWDVVSGRQEAVLRGHLGLVARAAFLPDGRRLVTGGSAAREAVKLWDLQTERELLSLPAEGHFFMDVTCSPDGNTLAATSFTGAAYFWRVPSSEEIEAADQRNPAAPEAGRSPASPAPGGFP